jgi:hypothetical protein
MLDLRQAYENKVISEIADLVKTNNLLVEFAAVRSGHAAEDDHDRLLLPLSRRDGTAIIATPEATGVSPRFALPERVGWQRQQDSKQQSERQSAQRTIVSHWLA